MRSLWFCLLCLWLSPVSAYVHDLRSSGDSHLSMNHAELARIEKHQLVAESAAQLQNLRGASREETGSGTNAKLPDQHKTQCFYMMMALCFVCCCGGVMQSLCGEKTAAAVSSSISIFLFVYLLASGIYGQLIIKNTIIASMRNDYEQKMKEISGPRKDYYESQLFKDKCDRLFEKADADGSGTLDMHELEAILEEVTGQPNIKNVAPLLQQAFEEHGDSVVEKHEFVEMMKFVSVTTLQEGKFTLEQAYEILQVEQGATKSEVTKSYRKMAIKYHPDKRTDVDAEVAKRDMAQINDAKAKVDEYLKLQEKTED